MTEIIEAWRDWHREGASGLLKGDHALSTAPDKLCDIRGWDAFVGGDQWASKTDRVHLGLLPMPYVGSLATARVFVLLLNPGFSPLDYFGEYRVPEYRTALSDCLVQNEASDSRGFYFLTPESSWHSGFRYWHSKLLGVVEEFSHTAGMPLVEAFAFVRRHLAAIELVPYHSESFGLSDRVVRDLRSVQLAQKYVREVVLPRAARGDATVVITRKAREWGVEPGDRVIVYGSSEARAAHLSPNSRGGRAILDAMLEAARHS